MASTIPSVPCVPDYTGCKYKSVTLNAGEQIILPPNAEIISVSSDTAITSEDGCYDLTKVESPVQYFIYWGGPYGDDGSQTEMFEKENNYINGIRINGTYYAMTQTDGNSTTQSNLQNNINAAIGDGIVTVDDVIYDDDSDNAAWNDDRGWGRRITITVVPSIGDNLELHGFSHFAESAFGVMQDKDVTYFLPTVRV